MADNNSNDSNNNNKVPVTLQWNKQTFDTYICVNELAVEWKQRVQAQTGVPVARQKLLWVQKKKKKTSKKSGWKGALKDDVLLNADMLGVDEGAAAAATTPPLTVTLIGSAEAAVVVQTQTQKFVEDLTPQERQAAEHAEAQAAMATATGMIPALQLLPQHRHGSSSNDALQTYNRLVTGLPQGHIEQELKKQQQPKGEEGSDDESTRLQGTIAMTMGLELRRAYVNDLCVLTSGECVVGLDDGHVQLWKHAELQYDVVHPGNSDQGGGVDSVVALSSAIALGNNNNRSNHAAFATAGRGALQLWTAEADPLLTIPSPVPGTSPDSLVSLDLMGGVSVLAARCKVTRPNVDPSLQFRLPPQNEAERERREQAQAQERALQASLARAARCIPIWYTTTIGGAGQLSFQMLEPTDNDDSPVTCLAAVSVDSSSSSTATTTTRHVLVAGDANGGLRIWKVSVRANNHNAAHNLEFVFLGRFPLEVVVVEEAAPSSPNVSCCCSIVDLEPLPDGRLAVSTAARVGASSSSSSSPSSLVVAIPHPQAVHVLDLHPTLSQPQQQQLLPPPPPRVTVSLTGHSEQDSVLCMCSLPNGDFLTGGKLDATLQLWKSEQLLQGGDKKMGNNDNNDNDVEMADDAQHDSEGTAIQSKAHQTLSKVGYVFALAVLPDIKEGSNHYAVAAARYNTVKIVI